MPVKPSLSGELPSGFVVQSIRVTPNMVKLTAEPSLLANILEIKSAPIVLENITGDVELKVPLNIPDKVLADTHSTLVEIKLKKLE